jgi:hypothetical protein
LTVAPPPVLVSMLPVTVNLKLYQGDDFYLDLTVTNPDGTPADLTGYTAQAQIRTAVGAPDPPEASFTASVDTSASIIHLHLPHTEAEKLTAGVNYWDCQISSTEWFTLAAGKVTVTGEITTT